MKVDPKKLKKFLVDAGLVTGAQFEKAEKEATSADREVGEVLVAKKVLKSDDLSRIQAHILGIPFENNSRVNCQSSQHCSF
jgi:hypothetical protein